MATIQQRQRSDGKKQHRVQIRIKGFPPQSATFDRLTDAKRWAQQTEAAIREGRYFKTTESRRRTFAEMIERYDQNVLSIKTEVSAKKQRPQLNWWKSQLGNYTLGDVTPSVIVECRDRLASEKTCRGTIRSKATVNRYLAALSHCFSIAVREWEWLDDSPMRKVSKYRESNQVVRFLSDDERIALLIACEESQNQYLNCVVVIALSTGMRRNEILTLTWNQIDFDRRTITLSPADTKNSEYRVVPLAGKAFDLLHEVSRIRRIDSPLVFPAKARIGKEAKPTDIQTAWKFALKRAQIDDFRFHDLRHSAASYLAMNGATLSEIAEVLGHKTLQMVKRYAHLSEAHTSSVVQRMNEKIFQTDDAKESG